MEIKRIGLDLAKNVFEVLRFSWNRTFACLVLVASQAWESEMRKKRKTYMPDEKSGIIRRHRLESGDPNRACTEAQNKPRARRAVLGSPGFIC